MTIKHFLIGCIAALASCIGFGSIAAAADAITSPNMCPMPAVVVQEPLSRTGFNQCDSQVNLSIHALGFSQHLTAKVDDTILIDKLAALPESPDLAKYPDCHGMKTLTTPQAFIFLGGQDGSGNKLASNETSVDKRPIFLKKPIWHPTPAFGGTRLVSLEGDGGFRLEGWGGVLKEGS